MRTSLFLISIAGLLLLPGACKNQFYPQSVKSEQFTVEAPVKQDSAMAALIRPYKNDLEEQMTKTIGELDTTLYHRQPDGTLGRWIADALSEEMEELTGEAPDFALHNFGGIRLPALSAGPLTVGTIYQVVPFDNALVRLTADSATVRQLVTHFMDRGGWPVSQSIDIRCTQSSYDISIAGEPLQGDRKYDIAMPDYIANGGDDSYFLRDNPRVSTGQFVRDVIIEFTREVTEAGRPLKSSSDRRIHCTKQGLK